METAITEKNLLELDILTGLYNRWRCRIELQNVLDNGGNRVFGLIDVDNFKHVAQTCDNLSADNVLKNIAKVLVKTYPEAFICRISADEFGFILQSTVYSRYRMSEMTSVLYNNLHELKVEGMEDYRLSFSIGTVFIDTNIHKSPDDIYREATRYRMAAKKHEGNYLSSAYGEIPDIAGAFYVLREDRQLYNKINNSLFSIKEEADWLKFLHDGARMKEGMFARNQGHLDDILKYFKADDLPRYDYDLLYDLVLHYHDALDAFMFDMFIGNILIPYYEHQDIGDQMVVSKLGYLYVMLASSMLSISRMGDTAQLQRIPVLLHKCLSITQDLPHNSLGFESHYYALCMLIGNYECVSLMYGSLTEFDRCYAELRELVMGNDPVVLHNPDTAKHFDTVVSNARMYPMMRACFLKMKGNKMKPMEEVELGQRLEYIRQHLVDDVYDMTQKNVEAQQLAKFMQHLLLDGLSYNELLVSIANVLSQISKIGYGLKPDANLEVVTYLFIGASRALQQSDLSNAEKRKLTFRALDFLMSLCRNRENIANDYQMLFLVKMILRVTMATNFMSPVDKFHYLEFALGSVTIDAYSHSKAVGAYAKVILANIIDNHAQMLVGDDRPYNTVADVKANRQQLLNFMDCACTLHDIGKMNLVPITSNSYRKLTDQEFQLIMHHPIAGVDIIAPEPSLSVFKPFILQHHLWSNGMKGYPLHLLSDMNSNMQILVDILSICDSLEAATSRIGRNYRNAKNFLQILDEFYIQSGSRYSREVLQSVISSPETYFTIRQMVDHNWQQMYQTIFEDIVLSKIGDHRDLDSMKLPDIYEHCQKEEDTQATLANAELMRQYEALINAFEIVLYTDMDKTEFKLLKGYPTIKELASNIKTTRELITYASAHLIDEESMADFADFIDQDKLQERFRRKENVVLEFHSPTFGWLYARLLPAAFDAEGNVTHVLFTTENFDSEHQQKMRLLEAAYLDGLTGLLNRARGEEIIRNETQKGGAQIFAILDCDNLKLVNENMSRLVGDQILQEMSHALKDFFPGHKIMRLGGDEFVVYLNGEDAQRTVWSLGGVKAQFSDLSHKLSSIRLSGMQESVITVSMGVAYTDGATQPTFDQFYKSADAALRESRLNESTGKIIVYNMSLDKD